MLGFVRFQFRWREGSVLLHVSAAAVISRFRNIAQGTNWTDSFGVAPPVGYPRLGPDHLAGVATGSWKVWVALMVSQLSLLTPGPGEA